MPAPDWVRTRSAGWTAHGPSGHRTTMQLPILDQRYAVHDDMAHPNRRGSWILIGCLIRDSVGVEHDDVSVRSNADSALVAHLGNSLLQNSRRDQAGAPDCLVERNYFSISHPASQNTRKTSGDARVRDSSVGKRPIILVDETARSQVRHRIGGDRRVWKQQRGLQERAIRCNVLPE